MKPKSMVPQAIEEIEYFLYKLKDNKDQKDFLVELTINLINGFTTKREKEYILKRIGNAKLYKG